MTNEEIKAKAELISKLEKLEITKKTIEHPDATLGVVLGAIAFHNSEVPQSLDVIKTFALEQIDKSVAELNEALNPTKPKLSKDLTQAKRENQ